MVHRNVWSGVGRGTPSVIPKVSTHDFLLIRDLCGNTAVVEP